MGVNVELTIKMLEELTCESEEQESRGSQSLSCDVFLSASACFLAPSILIQELGYFHLHSTEQQVAKRKSNIISCQSSAFRARGSLLLYFWPWHLATVYGNNGHILLV